MQTFKDIISLWNSIPAFAAVVAVRYETAHSWWKRDSIPSHHWPAVERACAARGRSDVTLEVLAEIGRRARAQRLERRRAAPAGQGTPLCPRGHARVPERAA